MEKKIYSLIFILFFSFNSKAQYVNIPDSNFRTYLMAYYPSCFNGANMLDTTCAPMVIETSLYFGASGIADFTGLQYFDSLSILDIGGGIALPSIFPPNVKQYTIDGSQVAIIPALPPGLNAFTVTSCYNLLSLPVFPASLTYLDCSGNDLITLPSSLPPGLQTLKCSRDSLMALPSLPSQLIHLECSENQLTSLPALPSALENLTANRNKLSNFPAFPSTLKYLDIGYNLVTTVPALPEGLNILHLGVNQLTSLPGHLPDSLKFIDCGANQLTTLPVLPSTLSYLGIYYNQITSLPTLPNSIMNILCMGNQLQSLPQLPSQLTQLLCYNNQLTSLPPLSPLLQTLSCNNNQIYFLPALPQTLQSLDCYSNNITCLPVLPPGSSINISMDDTINCVPNIASYFIQLYNSGFPTGSYHSPVNDPYPYCSAINNSNHCDAYPLITGYVFNDNNNNGVRDLNEPYRANIKMILSNGAYTLTNSNGYFEIPADSIGAYTATVVPPDYFTGVPLQYNYNFSSYDTLVSGNFALQATSSVDSLSISITALSIARPGRSLPYLVHYENVGTTQLNANIVVNYNNSLLAYDSSSNAAVTNGVSSLQLAKPGFVSGEQNNFIAYFTVNTAAQMNDTVITAAAISANSISSTDTAVNLIMTSFDPNDKQATATLTPLEVSTGSFIYYNIRFQNTGNDTAFNVVITDTLNNYLQPGTLEVVNTSHPCKTTVTGNAVSFEFLNILLPDSNVNELKSHGFVRFRIKPQPGAPVNSNIPNNAAIYFDYNSPVVTNTAITQISEPIVIPLKLLSFTVTRQTGNGGLVNWSTANEMNVKEYIIESSLDGRTFRNTAVENARSGQFNSYSRYITIPDHKVVYFRIKMIDIDGQYTYSPVVILRMGGENESFAIANNPVKNILIILLKDEQLKNTTGKIINSQGVVMQTVLLAENIQYVDTRNLQAGLYIFKTERGSKQFVITN